VHEIGIYKTNADHEPYTEWLISLDRQVRTRIDARLTRIRFTGNLGDFKPVGDGVYELRLDFGPGYRVYFGFDKTKNRMIVLLAGGSKRTQVKDIVKAKKYWQDYLSH
jgi:putative addiction module killer protein